MQLQLQRHYPAQIEYPTLCALALAPVVFFLAVRCTKELVATAVTLAVAAAAVVAPAMEKRRSRSKNSYIYM